MFPPDPSFCIGCRPLFITSNVKSVSNCFRNSQSEIQSYASRDYPQTVKNSPTLIECVLTIRVACWGHEKIFIPRGADEGYQSSNKLSKTLVGEDSCHHCSSPFHSSKLT